MKIEYNGEVSPEGKMRIFRQKDFIKEIKNLAGKLIKITIERRYNKRSLSQNAYWHGVVVSKVREGLAAKGFIFTAKEVHELLRLKFAVAEKVNEDTGEVIEYIKSTSEMSVGEFMDFMSEVSIWADKAHNIEIPQPGEQLDAFEEYNFNI